MPVATGRSGRFFSMGNLGPAGKAQELENYYIYVVFEVASKRPKVWRWRHPFKEEREREALEPVLYRFQSA